MSPNHKLTSLIKGRTITNSSQADGVLLVHFTDGSTMTVQLGGAITGLMAGTVTGVRQGGTSLVLEMDDGALTVETAEATSSVMVRDRNHVMEYAD